jgi:NADPH-dependent glutamate synthase beta subunit-like oxidoreductase/ferredoxin
MRDVDLTSRDVRALSSPAELMDREWAPCRYNCPVHADVRAYIEHISQGRYQDAVDVIRRNLAFAAVCGRICHHPCEANCRRAEVDQAVAIRELKRFVSETQGAGGATVQRPPSQDKARVAVVGAGPAGMAAALELARLGYRPTVFEMFPVAGGIPATAIPKYRMPREVLQIDIDWICAHGVELVTGCQIGKDKTLAQLEQEGFAAVLIATGLARSRTLPMPGADHARVYPVLEFLQSIAFERPVPVGQDVLVIGGGNVAVDAARSAVRLGAGRVRMMCLESQTEMPAWEWERDEAREEGVSFLHRRGPTEVLVRGGAIAGVRARKVTRVFDENKRFSPQYDDSDVVEVPCDTVVMAIGQMPDPGFARGSGLELDARGRLAFDPATQQTNLPHVFACGEIVTPPGSVVEACASGVRAVKAIDAFLSGRPIRLDDTLPPYIGKIDEERAGKVLHVDRAPVPTEEPQARRRVFTEMDHTYAAGQALRESRRCMSCGAGAEVLVDKCAACLTCLRVCPFGIPRIDTVARIDSALCQACGICIAECPANAIISRSRPTDDLAARTAAALAPRPGRDGPADRKVVAYVCGQHATADE